MNETYKFLKKIITKNWNDITNEDMCDLYQETHDNEILAYQYCKNFALWKKLTQKYGFLIEREDLSSYVLEYLDKIILAFNKNKNNNFIKFATIVMRNKLISTNIHYESKNRLLKDVVSYDANSDEDEELAYINLIEDVAYENLFKNSFIELDLLNNFNLTDNEKKICELVLRGEAINKLELAEGLNRNRLTIYEYLKKLGTKLNLSKEYFRY